jgi:transposase-like protein
VSPDDPWAYWSCPRCDDAGWIVRLGGHEEGYWRYWCVRCWREFKSSVWMAHARKPFLAAAAIPVALVLMVQLL